jgi:hypothetical protein
MWDNDNVASIVCRQLGFTYGQVYTFGAAGMQSTLETLPVAWGFRKCAGNERNIFECPQPADSHPTDPTCDFNTNHQQACSGGVDQSCNHNIDLGAICYHGNEQSQLMPSIETCTGCKIIFVL